MTAPGSVKLQQDILVIVDDKFLVAEANNNGDGALLGLRNRLRLDAGINLAIKNILDELANLLGINLLGLVVGVLGVLGGLLDGKSRELFGLQVQIAGVGPESLRVKGDDVNLTTVLFSNRAEVLGEFLALFLSLGKNVSQRNPGLKR